MPFVEYRVNTVEIDAEGLELGSNVVFADWLFEFLSRIFVVFFLLFTVFGESWQGRILRLSETHR